MRKSTIYIALSLTAWVALMSLLVLHPPAVGDRAREELAASRRLVRDLRLTDPCLFVEAGYTRHLSMADLHTAFQDHPVSLEHFPSGSMTRPPSELWNAHRELD